MAINWQDLIGYEIQDAQPTHGGAYLHLSDGDTQIQGWVADGLLDELPEAEEREEVPTDAD